MKRTVKKPEERRQDIIEAAKMLFLEQDYASTTMQDVMKKLNIAKGTIYHYFKSKDEILDAVIDNMIENYLDQLKARISNVSGSAVDKMKLLLRSEEPESMLDDLHKPGNIDMHSRLLAVTILKLSPLYAEIIEQGNQEKLFDVEHPLETAELLLAGIQFLTDMGCHPWSHQDLARRTNAIPSLLEAQLGATKGTFTF